MKINCLLVGGCGDGSFLEEFEYTGEPLEVKRPQYIKPLAHSKQAAPDVSELRDVYVIHPLLFLKDADNEQPIITAIGALEGQAAGDALSKIYAGYCKSITQLTHQN